MWLPESFIKRGAVTEIQRDKGCDRATQRGSEGKGGGMKC